MKINFIINILINLNFSKEYLKNFSLKTLIYLLSKLSIRVAITSSELHQYHVENSIIVSRFAKSPYLYISTKMEYTKFMNSIRRLPLNYPLLLIKIDNFLRAIGAEQKHNGSVQRELQKYINFEMKLKIYESTNIQKSSKQKMDGHHYTPTLQQI